MTTTKSQGNPWERVFTQDAIMLMLSALSGEIFSEADSAEGLETFLQQRELLDCIIVAAKNTSSKFDEHLRTYRKLHGSDFLEGQEFRKTVEREKKVKNDKISVSDLFTPKK